MRKLRSCPLRRTLGLGALAAGAGPPQKPRAIDGQDRDPATIAGPSIGGPSITGPTTGSGTTGPSRPPGLLRRGPAAFASTLLDRLRLGPRAAPAPAARPIRSKAIAGALGRPFHAEVRLAPVQRGRRGVKAPSASCRTSGGAIASGRGCPWAADEDPDRRLRRPRVHEPQDLRPPKPPSRPARSLRGGPPAGRGRAAPRPEQGRARLRARRRARRRAGHARRRGPDRATAAPLPASRKGGFVDDQSALSGARPRRRRRPGGRGGRRRRPARAAVEARVARGRAGEVASRSTRMRSAASRGARSSARRRRSPAPTSRTTSPASPRARGGEKHRVRAGPVPAARLQEADAAAEQAVLACVAHRPRAAVRPLRPASPISRRACAAWSLGHHQPAREGADHPLEGADMAVGDEDRDVGVLEKGL